MRALQCLSLALLFLASAVPSKAQDGAAEARVVVREGAPLTVECGLRVEQRAEWRRDGGAVPPDMRASETTAGGRLTARLHVATARAHHAGLYSCSREPAQQVRVVVQPAPALAPAPSDPVAATSETSTPAASVRVDVLTLYKFELGQKFILNCSELSSVKTEDILWQKNGTDVSKIWDLAGRYEVKEQWFQMTARTNEDDFGNYTCSKRGVTGIVDGWQVQAIPHAKLPANTNVVEGQKFKLQCKLIGKPYMPVTWTYSNDTNGSNAMDVNIALNGRARLQASEQGVEGAELVVEAALRSDAGNYTCIAGDSAHTDFTILRVKDMYAALWPFLGICIEVFILCAVILVYEKRRTKPELDDSDTDNHDQKKS